MISLFLALATAPARAAEGPRLPVVQSAVEPAYPASALASGEGASVLLEVLVSEEGLVLDAAVAQSGGLGFDEAALAAIAGYRFSPALDDAGEPAAAVIQYRIVFEAQAVEVEQLRGQVRWGELGVEATLQAQGPRGQRRALATDAEGRFSATGMDDGTWALLVEAEGLESRLVAVRVAEGETVELDIELRQAQVELEDDVPGMEVVIVGERVDAELYERRITAEEIAYLPGSSGDVVKAVQNLPGIARAPLGIGQLIVRGNNAEDTLYTLDGSPIPLVFHFAGLTSVVPSDALDEVAFLPGNSSVRYGRVLGGVVDLRTTQALPQGNSRAISVDLYQSAAFVEQRLGERSAITLSARRSYADAVLGPILNQADGIRVQAPRYWDGQLRYQYEGPVGTWDVMLYASDDRFRFLGLSEDEEDELVLAAFADQFQRLRVRRLDSAGPWTRETTISLGPERRFFEFGTESDAIEQLWSVAARQEFRRPITDGSRFGGRFGVDVLGGQESFDFFLAGFGEREKDSALFMAPALYGELSARVGPVTLIPGLRADALAYDTGYTAWSLDPRLAARVTATDSTVVTASVGQYSAFPGLREVSQRADGNPKLGPERSLQLSAGVRQQLPLNLSLEATWFTNRLTDLVVGREDRLEFFSGPPPVGPFDTGAYANEGTGLSYGLELQARYEGERALGLATVTWSHSERQDREDEPVELFAYDQPWVINLLWTQELNRGWRLGGRFRYGSGNPYTPVVNRWYDSASRQYVPVYGDRSSARLPAFKSLDLRVDKLWELQRLDITTFLEVQNVTNAQNIEVLAWNFDYSEQDPITGYPPLPVFGVKGSW